MEDQSVDWAEYARIQEELRNSSTFNDRNWGLEYALDKSLDDIAKGNSFVRSDVERRIRTGSRRKRHRSRLLRVLPLTWQPEHTDPAAAIEARSALDFLQAEIDDFYLIEKVAMGYSYDELISDGYAETGTLRKRVSRSRQRARALVVGG